MATHANENNERKQIFISNIKRKGLFSLRTVFLIFLHIIVISNIFSYLHIQQPSTESTYTSIHIVAASAAEPLHTWPNAVMAARRQCSARALYASVRIRDE